MSIISNHIKLLNMTVNGDHHANFQKNIIMQYLSKSYQLRSHSYELCWKITVESTVKGTAS